MNPCFRCVTFTFILLINTFFYLIIISNKRHKSMTTMLPSEWRRREAIWKNFSKRFVKQTNKQTNIWSIPLIIHCFNRSNKFVKTLKRCKPMLKRWKRYTQPYWARHKLMTVSFAINQSINQSIEYQLMNEWINCRGKTTIGRFDGRHQTNGQSCTWKIER